METFEKLKKNRKIEKMAPVGRRFILLKENK
jgi:hypothetical protein